MAAVDETVSLNVSSISIKVDLSNYVGIDITRLRVSPFSKVIGDWEAMSFGSPGEFRHVVLALLPVIILSIRFVCNAYMAAKLLYKRRESVFWLNMLQAAVGVIAAFCAALRGLAPWAISCSSVAYTSALDIYAGTSAIVGILFAKAYYGTNRSRPVLYLGTAAILLTFGVGLMANWALVTFEYASGRCAMALDYRWIVAKFSVDISSNIFLSGSFLYAMWIQSRNRRHHLFWMLFQDGLIYGFSIILSNVIATTIVLTMRSLSFWHAHIYAIDLSTLICWQIWYAQKRQRSNKTRTKPVKMADLGIIDDSAQHTPQQSWTAASASQTGQTSQQTSTQATAISEHTAVAAWLSEVKKDASTYPEADRLLE
ncbi:hypothetical protein THASP1DRAFT_33223 [Thamnocephalis sphaerospora]|uniref:Uncharacterized protein n=1 Tax=Thamnocephalis sphaerospora TaxID=78915 RepID=A0A4P9XH15_9FUNG|nr:hypothetical protein THASP1DRAFT_33223 [Thamnocephalis sphaerospora]|eukprot:RKP04955.1 hypothetical protein THASP1DRAFT_33223 [Thamnocephalis sphaerospora]